jgi:hypothetical protein
VFHTEVRQGSPGWVGAAAASAGFGVLAWFLWGLGSSLYLERYCGLLRGPEFASPVQLRCRFEDGTALTLVDLTPLLWTLFVVVVLALVLTAVWAGHLARDVAVARGRAVMAVTGLMLAVPGVGLALQSPASWFPLVLVTACALGGAMCLREAAGTRARWPWLVATLLAPAWCVASALGV